MDEEFLNNLLLGIYIRGSRCEAVKQSLQPILLRAH
jgi:hypothetical protein